MGRRPLCVCLLFFLAVWLTIGQFTNDPEMSGQQITDGQQVVLSGVVSEVYEPLKGSEDNCILYLKQIQSSSFNNSLESVRSSSKKSAEQDKIGAVCYLKDGQKPPYVGAVVQIKGTAYTFSKATNPGEFDMASYYELRGFHFRIYDGQINAQSVSYDRIGQFFCRLRLRLAEIFVLLLGEKNGALASAMVLGRKNEMDGTIKALYQSAGISHILAISGLHISIVAGSVEKLLRKMRIPSVAVCFLAGLLIVCYGVFTGMGVSTLRAVIMFLLTLTAGFLNRTPDILTSLLVAAAYVLVREPGYLKDAGFQLSFSAMTGLALVVPVLKDRGLQPQINLSCKRRILNKIYDGAAVSLGVALAMLPFLLAHFFTWNPWSVLFNPAAVFLTGILLPQLFFLAAAGAIFIDIPFMLPVLRGLAFPAGMLFEILEKASALVQKLPGSCLHTGMPKIWQFAVFGAGMVLLLCLGRKVRPGPRLGIAALLICVFLVHFPGKLRIVMLDVGQGQCIVVQTPGQQTYLLDAGSTSKSQVGKYQIVPYLKYSGTNRVDGIFISHWDEDHISGLEEILEWAAIEQVSVGALSLPDVCLEDAELIQLLALAKEYQIPVLRMGAGDVWKEGKCCFRCLHPLEKESTEDRNGLSMVLRLEWEDFAALFPGDLEQEQETRIISEVGGKQLSCQLLTVGHHGSATSSSEQFLEAVNPTAALISCGVNNRYGHPHQEVLMRLKNEQVMWYTTAQNGAVTVTVDREKMLIRSFLHQ